MLNQINSRLHKTLHGSRTIRERLILLVISCILPAAIATAVLIYYFYQYERTSVERTTIETARALMQVVDRELFSAQGTLQTLATSPYLASGDLPGFYGQAKETLSYRPGDNVILSDATGQQLINTLRPLGTALP